MLRKYTFLIGLAVALAAPRAAASDHWSLQPRAQPTVPENKASTWVRNPIDAFILHKLQKAGLQPASEADRATLLRRLSFDLTGLPPTPEEIAAFVADDSTSAYEKQVDRLLASPHYGERWGRHWLDVVRYAESEGFEYDRFRPGAWRYRDYVIKAFNEDRPFDSFLLEQIAGDEVDPDNHEALIAAGFHRLGPVRRNAGNKLVAFSRNEVLTEMTDAIGSVFLGLTMGCARCHDHRFDDISQKDYYHLQAYFAAVQEHDLALVDAKTQADWQAQTNKITGEIKQLQKALQVKEDKTIESKINEFRRKLPAPLPTISTIKHGERTAIHLLKRGDVERKGIQIGPRPLSVLMPTDPPEFPGEAEKPRTQLAKWLSHSGHPLVLRVFVNRIWQGHFGTGIVATPNDFGVNGSPPSHPELLDWLANEFLAHGRRVKPLHRLIVLSSTYRQASAPADADRVKKVDPENRLLSHFPRRRLSGEEIRDAMLSVSGKLNVKAGGPSVMTPVEPDLVKLLYDPAQWIVTPDTQEHNRRSVYLAVKRNLQLPFARAFDQPDAAISCPRRESSTHPLQALEMLNGKLANKLADAFADRLQRECGDDRAKQVDLAFRLTAGRAPTLRERELALEFVRTQSRREFALAMFNLNAFLYVN
jgi:hypothetical protein